MRDILDDDAECNSCAVMCYSGVLLFLWLLLHTRAAYAFMQFNSALSELNVWNVCHMYIRVYPYSYNYSALFNSVNSVPMKNYNMRFGVSRILYSLYFAEYIIVK